MYDSVKVQNSSHVEVSTFIRACCGAISIEETNETREKGKYIVVVPEEKVDSARIAIGKMFQEFQQSGGRPAAMACLSAYQNYPLLNDTVTISGLAQRLSERIRKRYQNRPITPLKNQNSSASYSYHGSTTIMHEQRHPTPQPPTVPRSIVRNKKNTSNTTNGTSQWPTLPTVQQQQQQQQQQTTSTNQAEERTVMSNLSPYDSAKTMMTNVSRMVETLGRVVNALAKETANTNGTMKQMMIQQTATMNNFMMLMSRNEERRQEVPVREIQQISTPTSTITNSQFSLSQQSMSVNKRKIDGIAEDKTTAVSTVENEPQQKENEDDIDAMLEEQSNAIEEIRMKQEEINDITMEDKDHDTNNHKQQQQQQNESTSGRITTSLAAADFTHQFSNNTSSKDKTNHSTSPGVNRQ
jgi:hypothetical protein